MTTEELAAAEVEVSAIDELSETAEVQRFFHKVHALAAVGKAYAVKIERRERFVYGRGTVAVQQVILTALRGA